MRRMENLVFSLNATVPIFLMMVLGMLFRKLGWMDEEFAAKMNKFVFLIPLPVLLFGDLAKVDFKEVWNIKFVIFCFVVTFICITIAALYLASGKTVQSRGNLYRLLTGAAQHFLELHLSRIFMEMQGWRHL